MPTDRDAKKNPDTVCGNCGRMIPNHKEDCPMIERFIKTVEIKPDVPCFSLLKTERASKIAINKQRSRMLEIMSQRQDNNANR